MNLEGVAGWLLLAAYLSLILEMTVFAIPSEASTLQLMTGETAVGSQRLASARRRTVAAKLLRYLLPTAIGVTLFLLPLAVACWPAVRPWTLVVAAESRTGVVAGLALILAGRLLTFTAVLHLRRRLRGGEHRLQRGGIFGVSRNPILVGMYLFYLGNCLWLPTPLLWAGFVLYVINMHRRVLMEEGFLEARFGADYIGYRSAVPRYVGFRRSSSDTR